MFALFKKELRYFFTSSVGYVVIGIFMLCNSLFLWVLQGKYNILDSGFADLQSFFLLSSWIFVFLIPAITMRTISEEKRSGMLQLLFTRPISQWEIAFGKFFAVLVFCFIILLFSVFYVFMVWKLGTPVGNLDIANTFGSYIALFLLACAFISVGIWASSISQNQIIAFVIATFMNFLLFFGLDEIISIFVKNTMFSFGFKTHFEDISRGVIDTRNVIYFLCVTTFFICTTVISLKSEKQ
ncbi:MAG: gliding motility-associated ABC transporter permease subunit GldF [Capnocytophaga sp.]|nr:gliding motility-associated ABC transporter permease subunit GldF [Capnocytophaga sp.]